MEALSLEAPRPYDYKMQPPYPRVVLHCGRTLPAYHAEHSASSAVQVTQSVYAGQLEL